MTLMDRALNFAVEKHGDQKYGSMPYKHHLEMVGNAVYHYPFIESKYEATAIAYLHDVVEDTDVSVMDIKKLFGETIAKAVDALTYYKEQSLYEYFSEISKDRNATIVKLMDRLGNMESAHGMGVAKKYIQQYPEFRASLYDKQDKDLWKRLDIAWKDLVAFENRG